MGFYPASYNQSRSIVPSDTVNFDVTLNQGLCDEIYCGTAGTVTVVYQDGSTQQFTSAVGTYLKVRAKRVNATGTAATLLVALYSV